jgi:acyl carrier protein
VELDAKFEQRMIDLIASGVAGKFKKIKITRGTSLQKELGVDSIGMLSLVFQFEELFGIDIAQMGVDVNIAKLKTVDDLIVTAQDILSKAQLSKEPGDGGSVF